MAYLQVSALRWNAELTGDEELGRRVQDELIPLLKAMPGFISYDGIIANEDRRTAVAVVKWTSREHGEAGTARAIAWTKQNAGELLVGADRYSGEVLISSDR